MKKIFLMLILAMAIGNLFAQSYEGTVEYLKKDQKAMVIEFPYTSSIVEEAIIQKMEKLGYKKKESKGFLIYKGAIISDISPEPADYMIKVERKSRKEKDESVVYILMNRGEENLIARSDAGVNNNVRSFLNGLSPQVEAYNLEQEIIGQEAIVLKAEKKLRQLGEDKETMERKIKKLQEDLVENGKDQEEQLKTIEAQKQVLEAMKGKRKA